MSTSARANVLLVDVDNTLLDNDQVAADLRHQLEVEVGPERRDRYWAIFEQLRAELGYADYLGALQRYRIEFPRDSHVLVISEYLVNYPFVELRILTAVKQRWHSPVSTVFPRQGHYAHDPKLLADYPPADVTIERIGDLLDYDLEALLDGADHGAHQLAPAQRERSIS